MEETIILDMSPKGQLLGAMTAQAASNAQKAGFRGFINALTDEQAQKLLALDGFTEPYKIPVWDDEIGGPIRDAEKKRDREPDRYIDGTTAPRRITDDLVVLLLGASFSMEKVKELADTYSGLDKINPEYWKHLVEILGKPQRRLLQNAFLPMLTGKATNAITEAALKNGTVEGNTLIIRTENGTVKIIEFDTLLGGCGTSAKKLFDTARAFLTYINVYRTGDPRLAVEIDLYDYWDAVKETNAQRTEDNIKDFKRSIHKDLAALEKVEVDFTEKSQDYTHFRFISSHKIERGRIVIYFDMQAAGYLVNAYMGQFPTALLKHDNRNPNSYAIGARIARHNSMYNNNAKGTANTLSVKSLLKAAPEIPTIEDLKKRKARNWKDKIKKPLEASLDANVLPPVCYLKKWEYRDPATGKTYTKEQAQALSWESFYNLMVDFIVVNDPDGQDQRSLEYMAKKEEQAQAAGKEKKKRGRPKKIGGKCEEQRGET